MVGPAWTLLSVGPPPPILAAMTYDDARRPSDPGRPPAGPDKFEAGARAAGASPALRASDADRERVSTLLQQACAEGRLDSQELDERLDAAYSARTLAELEPLTADLPAVGDTVVPASRSSLPAKAASPWVVAVMSGAKRKGRWRAARETTALAVMGGCEVDLREATADAPQITITSIAIMGSVEVIVPEGADVELEGIAIMGAKDCKVKDGPRPANLPRVRVRAFALMGSVEVKSRRPGNAKERLRAWSEERGLVEPGPAPHRVHER